MLQITVKTGQFIAVLKRGTVICLFKPEAVERSLLAENSDINLHTTLSC